MRMDVELTRCASRLFFRQFSKKIRQAKGTTETTNIPVFEYPVAKERDRRVYAWGLAETGALGLQTQRKDGILEFLTYPAPISLPLLEPEVTNVISIKSGRAHSIILTDREGAFTIGNNSYGQCGRPIDKIELYTESKVLPFSIPKVGNEDIVSIQCGQDHSIFINKCGQVFACGWGADGQTGLGHYRNEYVPTQLLGDIASEHIIKTAGTADCVLALNDKGDVFGWGNSEYGQLCQGNEVQQVNTPRHLPFCRKLGKIVDIAAGGSMCGVVTEQGDVFVWGFGILGKGPEVEHSFIPTQIPTTVFGKNDYSPNVFVTSINCGLSHFAAVTNQGDVYTWGRNRHACLGLGHYNNQYFPFKVAIGARVLKVSCGIDHNVVLCKPHI
ncbi:RCC1-like G exchanging factor-like protein isoform X2 [Ctenocephalides felis]|uniref:RCC1-like G exchanging factor-like protein isoform X2 n=1 Tax=Ctenocephalides felis TaxID=7515 RepID=UPI000E6E4D75|nr:RCC1-like G exchanging factor-like protein isoform X2 [Ctenocephalides felis]